MTPWTNEQLYFDNDAYFDDVLAAIDASLVSVDLETYIYDDDQVGARFEAALTGAARRGVKVRCLVDGIGGGAWAERHVEQVESSGVALRVYHPVALASVFRKTLKSFRPWVRESERRSALFSRLNRRDHRKVVVVDERIAFVGSLNISASHSARVKGELAWRDTGLRVEGPDILALVRGFEYAWLRSHTAKGKRRWRDTLIPLPDGKTRRARSELVRLNYTLRLRRKHYRDFSRRLSRAQKRIWITNAYLAPSKPIVRGLLRAAKRGVDVRILVPRRSDVFFMPWVATSYYPRLLKDGKPGRVRIFEYLPRFLHAKSVIIDDWAVVGTSNLNRRSLVKDFEVDIVLSRAETVAALEAQYARDLESSEEIRGPVRGGLTAALGRLVIWLMKELI